MGVQKHEESTRGNIGREMGRQMNIKLGIHAATLLTSCLFATFAFATDPVAPTKRHTEAKKTNATSPLSIKEQVQALRHDLDIQANLIDRQGSVINQLKSDLADKDSQLTSAQNAASKAQAAAEKAVDASSASLGAMRDNAAAVATLQNSAASLKASQTTLAAVVTSETAKIRKSVPLCQHE